MNYRFFLLGSCFLLAQSAFAQNGSFLNSEPFAIGESIQMHSHLLGEDRILNIYLPDTYSQDSEKEYPVIYLLDGSRDEDFIHIAGLVQFGSFSWINMLPESIVVGIANVDRKRDFTYPSRNIQDQKDFPTSGGSAKFMDFLARELQPLINDRYRTNDTRTIIGQSLGGLLAAEILLKKPELFDHYIIISPSLWWDDEFMLKWKVKSSVAPKSIYVGVGKEGRIMESVARAFYEKLQSSKIVDTEIYFGFFEALNHGDTLHLAAYDAFKKIFKGD